VACRSDAPTVARGLAYAVRDCRPVSGAGPDRDHLAAVPAAAAVDVASTASASAHGHAVGFEPASGISTAGLVDTNMERPADSEFHIGVGTVTFCVYYASFLRSRGNVFCMRHTVSRDTPYR
jgi:hypothetical protein